MIKFGEFFKDHQWNIVDVLKTEGRKPELFSLDGLSLAENSLQYLMKAYPEGIFHHQKEALKKYLDGKNICLITGTASGKSLVFQAAALDKLSKDPQAKVMAIYPMKALGNEQHDRWVNTFQVAGVDVQIGRIDGNVPPGFRLGVLERSQVVVFTPDIIHAWLFSNLNQPSVINFLKQVRLIVIDEVHSYSGVFGSNAAFLFRRLQHILFMLGAQVNFICASATIAHPSEHLFKLIGQYFELIGPEYDSSPRYPLDIILAQPPGQERFLNEVVHLLGFLTQHTSSRFIAFVDSRKQVELISSILNRLLREDQKKAKEDSNNELSQKKPRSPGKNRQKKEPEDVFEDDDEVEQEVTGVLQNLNVLPYRAGYEDHDRHLIQERLAQDNLNGIVSTSALELGIDIPHLDTCVLIGVPSSSTSLQQRIGRIGRHGPGTVIVVNGGDVYDELVFAHPSNFFYRPLTESALYLENDHIQYIHALCFARQGGEHDLVAEAMHYEWQSQITSPIQWPENFLHLCEVERTVGAPRHLMGLRMEGRERPNYIFPLRDVESQFKVERRDGPNVASMGSLSFGQLMREAYPGAIYYYATVPYRVTRVNIKGKTVQVRREKRYTTQPQLTPPAIFPRLTPEGINQFYKWESLLALECDLLVRESISGIIEQRGRSSSHYAYPLARELGFYQDQPYFNRNYFTTGVILTHPSLSDPEIHLTALAELVYEAFLLRIPFERQDIGAASDRFRISRQPVIAKDNGFLVIYDQTYGSLRLSSMLLDPQILGKALAEAVFLAGRENLSLPGKKALFAMVSSFFHSQYESLIINSTVADNSINDKQITSGQIERIIMPGSKGLMIRTNEEFLVERIIQTPVGLSYEGTPVSMLGSGISVMPLLSDVVEIPGESQLGWYDVGSGACEIDPFQNNLAITSAGLTTQSPEVDPDWLTMQIMTYFNDKLYDLFTTQLGWKDQDSTTRLERVSNLVDNYKHEGQLSDLLLSILRFYCFPDTNPEN